MKTKYVVLDDKLVPVKVANLYLNEALGKDIKSVSTVFNLEEQQKESYLDSLLIKAAEKGISHSYSAKFIFEMLSKMIKNNRQKEGIIIVEIIQGDKTFLHIYFKE